MSLKKFEMPVGQKVKGYGLLNEYGEFDFIPEQKGAREGEVKLIKRGDGFTLSSSKNCLIVHVRITKGNRLEVIKEFCENVKQLMDCFNNYEF